MLVEIKGHYLEITPALKNYVEEKMHKLEKHFNHIINVHVVLSIEEKFHHLAKAEVHLPGVLIAAEAKSADIYDAINSLSHKLDVQIIKYKNKMQHHHKPHKRRLEEENAVE